MAETMLGAAPDDDDDDTFGVPPIGGREGHAGRTSATDRPRRSVRNATTQEVTTVPTKTATKSKGDAKAAKETPDQKWERESRERAEKARDAADKNTIRRAGLTIDELRADDAKVAAEGAAQNRKFDAMTPEDRIAWLTENEPIPPWQKRLSGGKIIDARAQPVQRLFATDGTMLSGGDEQEAREFYLEYLAGETS